MTPARPPPPRARDSESGYTPVTRAGGHGKTGAARQQRPSFVYRPVYQACGARLREAPEFALRPRVRKPALLIAAIEGGADITKARLLAGHKVGISDHYIKRNPKMVEDVCIAIEKHYFGSIK